MEKFALTLQSGPAVDAYIAEHHLMAYELQLLKEITEAIKSNDAGKLAWFARFGDGFRQIMMNVNEYRHALDFGFTVIAFNRYGWFASPKFMDHEIIPLKESEIRMGRGPNGLWAYSLSCSYGTAGSSGPLCVFCKKYPNRDQALTAALKEMKDKMTGYLGNPDTTNYKQDVLVGTLKAIAALEMSLVQLTLF